ncbi:C2 domain protein [Teladorsagia circumcincta]|uniref:C2 domain protein n=1 Tax=Teladorsagia circumcincta TaxID=45464 RepID=A0A2G9V109_TELCI|nr:C2 domain protein [Teladorsagia circumcincta]
MVGRWIATACHIIRRVYDFNPRRDLPDIRYSQAYPTLVAPSRCRRVISRIGLEFFFQSTAPWSRILYSFTGIASIADKIFISGGIVWQRLQAWDDPMHLFPSASMPPRLEESKSEEHSENAVAADSAVLISLFLDGLICCRMDSVKGSIIAHEQGNEQCKLQKKLLVSSRSLTIKAFSQWCFFEKLLQDSLSVEGARGLYLKNQVTLDAYATVVLHGKGSLRSRAITEQVNTEGDCRWDEHCEFKISDKSTHITVTVQNKTKFGGADVIGKCEIPIDQAKKVGGHMWFPLKKKRDDNKYRGEVQLQFTFSYEKPTLSISNSSLNKIEKAFALRIKSGAFRMDSPNCFLFFRAARTALLEALQTVCLTHGKDYSPGIVFKGSFRKCQSSTILYTRDLC